MPTIQFQPVPPGAPIPHRKIIRSWTQPISERSTPIALSLVVLDLCLFSIALAATVWVSNWLGKVLLGMLTGFIIGRLFILGHDACHQSFTVHRKLNAWLGRLVFLPSLTPYSLWSIGHNVVHHGYTNVKDFDFVWQPHSLQEFQALPKWRQRLERLYRSGWAPGLYYTLEMWWKRMYFPSKKQMPTRRAEFLLDGLLVSAAAVLWVAGLVWAAAESGQSVWLILVTGFVVPLLFWKAMIGFVVYVHHTHDDVAWYQDKTAWAASQPFVSTTVHLKFDYGMGTALHHIMEHTAHHVDMSVPLYRLKKAQKLLETMLPGRIVIQKFSWRWYFDTARRCKLYDFDRLCWLDFDGRQTTTSLLAPPLAQTGT
ncbi:fatty acid desaturase [Herbaspirillum sp. RTI4]|uniref:fatty acid desaturase n=1 Tax=Herbaspirillum sp. RTI4 TaxID=3048640 RepID=UPI002AB4CC0D|nr:fatty acid desaturase [Herbaspirillum sp. RTI4]MDY7578992.1 fatty acid desaturase [Herbaspirillum sp. RTI4]MEA9980923.1 fatty acid desaturase [Herbaspirillum sp. RTI4]